MRCYEQVRNDICYQNLPIILIGIGSGITYAPAGMTHYSIEDIGLAKTMPNLNIISPSDPIQVEKAIQFAIKSKNPTYIRISRSGEPIIFNKNIDITQPIFLKKNNNKEAIIFHGSIVDEILKIKEKIDNIDIIAFAMIHPLNKNKTKEILKKYKKIYIIEEHFKEGGLGTILSDFIVENKIKVKIVKIAIDNHYIHKIGDSIYLREEFKIDSKSIIKIIKKD
jgi:transketolase